jgi:hypothetical protein
MCWGARKIFLQSVTRIYPFMPLKSPTEYFGGFFFVRPGLKLGDSLH